MDKTDTFFIISNYNTDPGKYLEYCKDYHIYDQSPDIKIREQLKAKYTKISFVENTGHNISDYFRYFLDNYDHLPAHMMLAKGNMIGRHISQEFFDRVYNNKFYTFLYDDRRSFDTDGVAYHLYDGALLEINNSWWALTKTPKYFSNFNDLLVFLFKDPIIPKWLLFSPGACYIVTREQVRKYPANFYKNVMELMSYTYFPSEAYCVERMMHIIFLANHELNPYMGDVAAFREKLAVQEKLHDQAVREGETLRGKAFALPRRLKNRLNGLLYRLMLR
jgi:hypothetical protein